MNYNCVILRNAEIGLKSRRKRPYFERLFVGSIKEALTRHVGSGSTVKNLGLRIAVYSTKVLDILPVFAAIPGINSFSPAQHFKFAKKEDIFPLIKEKASALVKDKTFRVSVSRTGSHTFSSMQLAKELADEIFEGSAGVDLHTPQVNVQLEIRNNDLFLFFETFQGLGGVPARATGKALMLFSGGIDSPVAAFQLLKRGCGLDYVHVDLVGASAFSQVIPVYNHLIETYQYNFNPRLFYLDAKKLSDYLTANVQGDLRQLALKVAFYKIANALCDKEKYLAFATGEAVSQKSTQTLPSLALLDKEAHHLTLRPLIDKDKLEIIAVAKNIGTWAYSSQVKEACSLSDGPVFAVPHQEDMDKIPNLQPLIDELIADMKIYEGVVEQEITVTPQEDLSQATIIDIRLPAQKEKEPFANTQSLTFQEARDALPTFDVTQPHIFICQHGVLGQELAYLFARRKGKAKVFTPKEYTKYSEEVHV